MEEVFRDTRYQEPERLSDGKETVSGPVALAVLGTLLERPMHAYELASTMRERHRQEHQAHQAQLRVPLHRGRGPPAREAHPWQETSAQITHPQTGWGRPWSQFHGQPAPTNERQQP
jgi:hypothetical protein